MKPCYITQSRIDQLNSIGFVWNRMGTAWTQSFENLKKYRTENGHCHVPVNYSDKTLFRWIAKQRKKYKNHREGKKPSLTEEQVKLLEEIDFFEPSEQRLAKYNAQKERERKEGKIKINHHKASKRGRPKAKTLIPQEAQELMSPHVGLPHTAYPNSLISVPLNYPLVGTLPGPAPVNVAEECFNNNLTQEEKCGTNEGGVINKPEQISNESLEKIDI